MKIWTLVQSLKEEIRMRKQTIEYTSPIDTLVANKKRPPLR